MEVGLVFGPTSERTSKRRRAEPAASGPRRSRRSTVSQQFDDAFAVVALLAAVAALWIAGEGAAGVALLAAGTISVLVVVRRRMRVVAATLAAARAELVRAAERDDDARRDRAALAGELARRAAEDRFHSLVCTVSDVLLIADDEGTIVFTNPDVERRLGFRAEDLAGRDAMGLVHPEDADRARSAFAQAVPTQPPVEARLRRRPGQWRTVELSVAPLPDAEIVQTNVVLVRDVADRKAVEARLTEQAFQDALTGLPNRMLLLDRLRTAVARSARRPETETALLLIDLDRFKTVNDRLGHAAGDELLVIVARRLAATLRAGDTAARLSGDEFGIVLGDVRDTAEALAVAERIGGELRRPMATAGREITLGVSIGVAVTRPGQHDHVELLRGAEVALDRAMGTGGAATFDPARGGAELQRLEMEFELRTGLERGQFELYYLPAIDLTSGVIATMEALIRWRHPTRGLLLPAEFLGVAEATGLIAPIGDFVLREACEQAAHWGARYGKQAPSIGVNLSASQLASPMIVGQVADVLRETDLPPAALTLEVACSLAHHDAEAQRHTLNLLREVGVRLAADDAGSGFSTLGNLTRLPVDELKIDREFVRSLGHDPEDDAIVEAVTHLAHARDMRVVAEGLETEALVVRVRDLGVDLGQGAFFANPLPLVDAMALLHQQFAYAGETLAQVAD
jgi:diguanylate cyclase (GGDEF)-like protein/PAS domain S-box-containing protein